MNAVTNEEIEDFLEDLKPMVTFHVETTFYDGGIARSQTTTLADNYQEVYKRHPKIKICVRRALMVLGKRNMQQVKVKNPSLNEDEKGWIIVAIIAFVVGLVIGFATGVYVTVDNPAMGRVQ
jgi:hypothetical protein